MVKRLVPLGLLAVAAALLLGTDQGRAFPPPQLQNFEQYQITCLGGAEIADPATLPPTPSCPGPEDKTPGATPDVVSGSILPEGQRLQLGYSYLGPGWPDGTTTVDGERTAVNMTTHLDYGCNDSVDKLAAYAWSDTSAVTEQALAATVGSETINIDDSTVLPDDGSYIRIESTIDAGPPARTKTETMILDSKAGDGTDPGVQDTMTVTRYDPSEHTTGARIDEPVVDTAGPNDFVMRTTSWGAGTGINGEDEFYLNEVIPTTLGTIATRARSAYTLFWYGGTIPIPLPPIPVNSVSVEPFWKPDASFSMVSFAGSPSSPTAVSGTSNSCTQAPQGGKGLNYGQYGPNPATKGLYARWTTSMGEADYSNGTFSFVYTTNCKAIKDVADPNFVDADNDCLAASPNAGHPGIADPNDSNNDIDGDGLMDGIEVAFGTCPDSTVVYNAGQHGFDLDCSTVANASDTDGDGNIDLEEMIGPSYLLTNPRDVDTDDDGNEDGAGVGTCNDGIDNGPDGPMDAADPDCVPFLDRNLKLDMYDTDADGSDGIQDSGSPDGKPDFPDEDGDRVVDSGFGPDWDGSADGSSNVRAGFVITGSSEADVCPNIADVGQEDFDGDSNGDACDPDDDQDGITDAAEATFKWDPDGALGAGACSNVPPMAGPATPLDPKDRDSDGDGFLDGVECELGSNPDDISSTPAADLGGDADGLNAGQEMAFHISPFSLRPEQPDEDVDGDGDIGNDDRDSDGDGISDGCEVAFSNTIPTNRMTTAGVTDLLADDARPEVTEIGNGAGLASSADVTMPAADDLDGFDCDLDADNDGRSNSDEVDGTGTGVCDGVVTDWGIDTSYDDDGDGVPCLGCLGGSDSWGDSGVDMVEDMDAGLEDVSVDLPGVQTTVIIDDGTGLAGYDAPQPIRIEAEEMTLISVYGDGPGKLRDSMVVTRAAAPVAHVATKDIDVRDDPPSWDTDGDAVLDGVECALGTDPTNPLVKPDATACGGTADTDGDGLQDDWEKCKWGTDPTIGLPGNYDTDGDGTGDCQEAGDVNGDGATNFVGDVIAYAKAALLPPASFGQDGDFDINGDGTVNFVGDVIQEAKFGLIPGLCK